MWLLLLQLSSEATLIDEYDPVQVLHKPGQAGKGVDWFANVGLST